jgi:HPt (histidine-containing phosphotransfer) domain-containing protein
VTKPVQSDELYAMIDQVLTPASSIEFAAALRNVEGDEILLAELLEIFQQDYPKDVTTMRDAIARGDARQLEHAAHHIKGSVVMFGATGAHTLAATLETMGRDGHLEGASTVLAQLEHELAHLVAFVADRLSPPHQP